MPALIVGCSSSSAFISQLICKTRSGDGARTGLRGEDDDDPAAELGSGPGRAQGLLGDVGASDRTMGPVATASGDARFEPPGEAKELKKLLLWSSTAARTSSTASGRVCSSLLSLGKRCRCRVLVFPLLDFVS